MSGDRLDELHDKVDDIHTVSIRLDKKITEMDTKMSDVVEPAVRQTWRNKEKIDAHETVLTTAKKIAGGMIAIVTLAVTIVGATGVL